jgi:hypothetical protein
MKQDRAKKVCFDRQAQFYYSQQPGPGDRRFFAVITSEPQASGIKISIHETDGEKPETERTAV